MKQVSLAVLFSLTLILTGCRNENQTGEDRVEEHTNQTQGESETFGDADQDQNTEELRVEIEPRSNSNVEGEAVFTQENNEVTLTVNVSGLEEGMHAIHLHENADCSAEDGTSAGGHWNPTFEDHGEWGDANGYHKGDIGNFKADADGNGSITFTTDQWCMDCDDNTKNIIGKSVMIHQGEDDFTSQPSGDAGRRIGCGEITR